MTQKSAAFQATQKNGISIPYLEGTKDAGG